MKIEKTQVFGFEASIRGLRNPLDSWSKSDSRVRDFSTFNTTYKNINTEGFILGDADKDLSQRLSKAGGEHRKHLRLVTVWVDMTLPRFIYQELDTYKHKENVSCSTIHKLMSYPITTDMFEDGENIPQDTIVKLNELIEKFKATKDPLEKKQYKYIAKTILPESFLQKRTVCTNYETLLNILKQREHHEMPQWSIICDWILALPYFTELTGLEVK
jgi:hypothetical protein